MININNMSISEILEFKIKINSDLGFQLAAVNKDGYLINFIENKSLEIQFLAVNQSGYVIQYIKNPSDEIKELSI